MKWQERAARSRRFRPRWIDARAEYTLAARFVHLSLYYDVHDGELSVASHEHICTYNDRVMEKGMRDSEHAVEHDVSSERQP